MDPAGAGVRRTGMRVARATICSQQRPCLFERRHRWKDRRCCGWGTRRMPGAGLHRRLGRAADALLILRLGGARRWREVRNEPRRTNHLALGRTSARARQWHAPDRQILPPQERGTRPRVRAELQPSPRWRCAPSMRLGTIPGLDVALHRLRRLGQHRPRLGHAEQQGSVMEIAGILGEKHAFDGTASKGLGTHTHFLRTRKTSQDFAAELRRDFGKLRVSADDRRARRRVILEPASTNTMPCGRRW